MKRVLNKLQDLILEADSHFRNDFELLHELFFQFKIDYCIIGGSSLALHNLIRATNNIDVLISKDSQSKLDSIGIGFMRDMSNGSGRRFKIHGMKLSCVEVIREGELLNLGGIVFPDPKEIRIKGEGIWVASLEKLIELKLSSGKFGKGRYQDLADVQRLILNNGLDFNFGKNFRRDLRIAYEEIWTQTI